MVHENKNIATIYSKRQNNLCSMKWAPTYFYYSIFIAFFLSISILYAQKQITLNKQNNIFSVSLTIDEVPRILIPQGDKRLVKYLSSINEDSEGEARLPHKIVFVALPPNTTIDVTLENVKVRKLENTAPILFDNDFTDVKYTINSSEHSLIKAPSINTRYPQNDVDILGYTWMSNYYCAVLRVNTHVYYPQQNLIEELESADIKYILKNNIQYERNTTPKNEIEKAVKSYFINADIADDVRSFRNNLSKNTILQDWIIYSQIYIKLAISEDGIYRIGYSDLLSYGVDPKYIDPRTIKIYERGKEIPLYIKGEEDGVFNNDDYIEFYGTKHYSSNNYLKIVNTGEDYINYMDRYTDTTYVWLTFGGVTYGQRGLNITTALHSNDTIKSHIVKVHCENDKLLWYYDANTPRTQLPYWQEHKVWTWNYFSPGVTRVFTWNANSVVKEMPCIYTVRFLSQGWDTRYDGTSAHKVALGFNNSYATDTTLFSYRQTINFTVSKNGSSLKEGANTLRIEGLSTNTSANVNQFLLDWFDVQYYQYTNAQNDSLLITIPDTVEKGVKVIKVDNLLDTNLILYKVRPSFTRITHYAISRNVPYTCTFSDTVSGGDVYLVITEKHIKKPGFRSNKKFVNLRDPTHGADYILITSKLLSASAAHYVQFLQSTYNIRTELVFVEDIFDEFSYGYPEPEGIRDFLEYAYVNWQSPPPTYLLIVGEANYDYKYNVTSPIKRPNIVPSYGYPVSDVWYTVWDTLRIGIPQMYVGRIPAKSDEEFMRYLQKHQIYLQRPYDEWNKVFLFFSGGDPSIPGQLEQIRAVNNTILTTMACSEPIGGRGYHFYKTKNPTSNYGPYSYDYVKNAFANGGLFISYIGHSGTQTWDNGITSVTDIKNSYSNRFPLITDFGCSTGKFAEPDIDCFGELFVSGHSDGQAILYISNSSLGFTSTSLSFPLLFYQKILKDTIFTISKAHTLAKISQISLGDSESKRTFNYCNLLFGDPIIRLALPPKPNIVVDPEDCTIEKQTPTDIDDSLNVRIIIKNLGLSPSDTIRVKVEDAMENGYRFRIYYSIVPTKFYDTTTISFPIRGLVGEHIITIHADYENHIDEINESDNSVTKQCFVFSTAIRKIENSQYYNSYNQWLSILNPSQLKEQWSESYLCEIDTSSTFDHPIQIVKSFDTLYTQIPLPSLMNGERYWWRVRINNKEQEWSHPSSFVYMNNNPPQWLVEHPIVSSNFHYNKTTYNQQQKAWILSRGENSLKITSAGFSDGGFVTVEYNGTEKAPNTFFWGIVAARVDSVSLLPYNFKYFTTSGGTTTERTKAADSLASYINSLNNGDLLLLSICTDGAQSVLGFSPPTSVRDAIKKLGSLYIDSVAYRDSWCILGKKGAAIGTVPESFKKQYTGVASINIIKSYTNTTGSITFPTIGYAMEWDSLVCICDTNNGSSIEIIPIGISPVSTIDTLPKLEANNYGNYSLKHINAERYPILQLLTSLRGSVTQETPILRSIAVYYKQLPDLAINYQTFGIFKAEKIPNSDSIANLNIPVDTVIQGNHVMICFRVYNVGGSVANRCSVKLYSLMENNKRDVLLETVIDSLAPFSYKEFQIPYSTSLSTGSRTIKVEIDPENRIREIYEDNNVFTEHFIVVKDSLHPIVPNVSIDPQTIQLVKTPVTVKDDTAYIQFIIQNSGAYLSRTLTISVKHTYASTVLRHWIIQRDYPLEYDTVSLALAVKDKPGQHWLQIELDPYAEIVESSESDNIADFFFTVTTTEFVILQPTETTVSCFDKIIFLNPTDVLYIDDRTANFEIDTLPSFETAKFYKLTMGEFITTFDLHSFPTKKRYYWRIKRSTTEDWTTGSFFHGDSIQYAIGIVDSIGWSKCSFLHAAYSAGGVRVENSNYHITALSAGFDDGHTGLVELNGKNVITPILGSGHCIVVLDSNDFSVIKRRRFDVSNNPSEVDSLITFIQSIDDGKIVIDVVVDDGSNNLTHIARNALKTIGSVLIDELEWRDSWAIIGRKGATPGTIREILKKRFSGSAYVAQTFTHFEREGIVQTIPCGPLSSIGNFYIEGSNFDSTSLETFLIGQQYNSHVDTIRIYPLQNQLLLRKYYKDSRLQFHLKRTHSNSPMLKSWTLLASPLPELVVSPSKTYLSNSQVIEGQPVVINTRIFNVGPADAQNVNVQFIINEYGYDRVIHSESYSSIRAFDSVEIQCEYTTRKKAGLKTIKIVIDPYDSLYEYSKINNEYKLSLFVIADTVKPNISVRIDGKEVYNGAYIRKQPFIMIKYTDDNPTLFTINDTANIKIRLNNNYVSFSENDIRYEPLGSGNVEIRWTPTLNDGDNTICVYAKDLAGNSSDTLNLTVRVSSKVELKNVFNYPNPMQSGTWFTFDALTPTHMEELIIKIYTISGRLIRSISVPCNLGYNRIYWDGRDQDGDEIANGVYLYKIIIKSNNTTVETVQKLAKVR